MPPPEKDAAVNPENQEKLLEEALAIVKREGFQMKLCLDNNKLMDGLKHASDMLSELRTSLLSPKSYYELYIAISDELRHLEAYLVDEFEKGRPVKDLYELVQYAGNIVPRLYLLVTVGSVYIHTKQAPRKDIMKDLVEMCRGVQHPLRGLFLRNYLLQTVKRWLPESTNTQDEDGCINDSIDFILLNFSEMNKLWVRMQHQGHSRDKVKREQERKELKILVGTNLVRVSSLEALTSDKYKDVILPAVLEQVISCKDPIAQEYLMECVIQVFPDDFHLLSLDTFLAACAKLSPEVNVKNIIIALIDRLANFALRDGGNGIPKDIKLFDIFSEQISQIVKARVELPLEDTIALQVSLANLALKCYQDTPAYVDQVLSQTSLIFEEKQITTVEHNSAVCKQLVRLVRAPASGYPSIVNALALEHFVPTFHWFVFETRRELANSILEETVEKETPLTTSEQATSFLEILSPLIKGDEGQPQDIDDDDFAAEQSMVGRLITLFRGETPDVQFQMLSIARKQFGVGGEKRVKFTMPPLVFAAIELARVYKAKEAEDANWDKKIQKIYQFCHQTITALAKADQWELSLRLFLQAALAADQTECEKSENIAYEFMSQAFMIYEEDISDSKAQMVAISLLIGTLEKMTCFSEDNASPLRAKCATMSNKLMKKADQCRGVSMCCCLFWPDDVEKRDGKQLLQCLQRALKVANSCVETDIQVQLFIEIFDKYLMYYSKGVEQVAISHINKIATLINENLEKLEAGEQTAQLKQHFDNSIAFINSKKSQGSGPSFAEFKM